MSTRDPVYRHPQLKGTTEWLAGVELDIRLLVDHR
jgi:hypothetical protein